MTGVEDALRALGPADVTPTVEELGGVDRVLTAAAELDSDLLPRLVESLGSWPEAPEHPALIAAVVERLPDVEGSLEAAGCIDAVLALTVASQDSDVARALMARLLLLVDGGLQSDVLALRAGYAIRAAADLALLDVGVTAHGVLAALENLPDVRPEMASSVARATGRLWEHHDEPFLRRVLEERVLPHDEAAGDGLVELGLDSLRVAFDAAEGEAALEALQRAQELFERARAQDEDRPDARAFAAACRAVEAFTADGAAMSAALDELAEARSELERYSVQEPTGFRGATPLRSVADWHVLAGTLRGLSAHLERPDILNLRPAIEALGDAYNGMRLGVLQDERHGLIGFIRPLVRDRVEMSAALKEGVAQYATEEGAPAGATELAAEVVRPKVAPTPETPRRRRRHPRR